MKVKPGKHASAVVLELSRRDEPLMAAASGSSSVVPFRLKKILVPIDFSDCARKALQYAIPLAKQHQAALTLLYVVPSTYVAGEYARFDYASFEADMRASGDKQLATLAVDEVRGEVPADTLVQSGSPPAEIIAVAKRIPADLIVISTHGRTGLKHVFLGSVSEYVVRHAACPVLVVREREHEFLAT
jgi:universal stress protein A